MPQGELRGGQTLADLIMQKIDEQEDTKDMPIGASRSPRIDGPFARLTAHPSTAAPQPPPGFNPKIVEVYTKSALFRSPGPDSAH